MVSGGTIVMVGIGGVLSFAGGQMVRRTYAGRVKAARTANAESKAIGDLTPGDDRVSVSGTVESTDDAIDAAIADGAGPVVKTEAATYNSGVSGEEQMTQSGGSFDYRQEVVQAAPFTVDDGTGTVRVAADGAVDAVVEPTAHIDVDGEASLPPAVSDLVEESGDDLIIGSQTDRLRQGVVTAGDDVVVQGVPQQTDGDVVLATGDVPMLVSDRPKADAEQAQSAGGIGKYLLGTLLLLVGLGVAAFPFLAA